MIIYDRKMLFILWYGIGYGGVKRSEEEREATKRTEEATKGTGGWEEGRLRREIGCGENAKFGAMERV